MSVLYKMGRLAFSLSGEGPVFDEVAAEISESLPRASGAADVAFEFRPALPRMSYRQTGDVFIGDNAYRLHRGGLELELGMGDPLHVVVAPRKPARRGAASAYLRRARDWNYLTDTQTLAKNFMYDVFDWATQLAQLKRGQSYIHASSMQKGDRGLAVLGWGGVGKTTTLLKLCIEDGWKFLSDDLGLVDDSGLLHRTPKRLQIYGYNLEGQPALRRRVLAGRSAVDRASWELRLRRFGPKLVRRRISASDMFGADGLADSTRLTDIVFLERSSEDQRGMTGAGSAELADRMAAIVMAEIEPYGAFHRQLGAAGLNALEAPSQVQARTAAVLARSFAGAATTVLRVGESAAPDRLAEILRAHMV